MTDKTDAQKRAQAKYMERFSVARVRMDRDKYIAIQAHAEANGESVNNRFVQDHLTTCHALILTEAGAINTNTKRGSHTGSLFLHKF